MSDACVQMQCNYYKCVYASTGFYGALDMVEDATQWILAKIDAPLHQNFQDWLGTRSPLQAPVFAAAEHPATLKKRFVDLVKAAAAHTLENHLKTARSKLGQAGLATVLTRIDMGQDGESGAPLIILLSEAAILKVHICVC